MQEALTKGVEMHVAGEFEFASQLYGSVIKLQPNHADANHNMGVLKVDIGNDFEALPYLQTALEADTNIAQFWLSYIKTLIKLDRRDEATRILSLAKETGVEGGEFHDLYQQLCLPPTIEVIENSGDDETDPTKPNILDNLKLDKALRLAKQKFKDGSSDEAKHIYQDILNRFPKNRRAINGMKALSGRPVGKVPKVKEPSQDQLQPIVNLYNQRKFQHALKEASQLLQQFPSSVTLYNISGAANGGLGLLDAAIEAYNKALSIKPDYADAYFNMGIALKDQEKLEEAIEAYNKALAIKPDYAEAYYNMGNDMKDKGEFDAAIYSYKQALKIKPEFAKVKHLLASLIGKTTKAAPREYVEDLFDQYATKFEHSLVEKLEYQIPKITTGMIIKTHPSKALGSVLDLGCGTGLAGLELKQFCENLDGIDLSKSMLEQARAKGVYDKLIHGDIIEHLTEADLDFDYFISTDVFIYVGELSDVFKLIKYRNKRRGKLVFSTEHTEKHGFHLETSGRYSHSKSYIEGLCNRYGYHLSHFERTKLRKEKSEFLTGGLYLLDFGPAE